MGKIYKVVVVVVVVFLQLLIEGLEIRAVGGMVM